jgi:hypothetical protein
VRALLSHLFAWLARDQATVVVEGTKVEGAALTSARLVGVGSASHCGGEHDRLGLCSDLFSRGRRGLSKPLCWRERPVRPLLWPLVSWVGVCSYSHCGGGHDRCGRLYSLCSLGRGGLSQPLRWWAQQLRALLWPLIARSAWARSATGLASTTG